MVSKRKNSIKHFRRRSEERIGVRLDPILIARKIRSGKLNFLRRMSLRVTLWEYEFQNQLYVVVYDKIRKTAVTIYPKSPLKEEIDPIKTFPL
ncbi:MAG: hypothetical protein IJ752_02885 [Alphaproteobacteria bacterium]|nr:hypothetical protein [Alphaproteobacteria bacterium]